ncbi:Hypothetical protein DHA2_153490 [Giardia duodenalis]|uniref:Uncharacterized protein n=1 Tax=Giardia intestinalis TaxID=5741 RepID=V6TB21_GIAIN|nr:Hypothetical protein DHA2_153490 [Giardia intestinalis]
MRDGEEFRSLSEYTVVTIIGRGVGIKTRGLPRSIFNTTNCYFPLTTDRLDIMVFMLPIRVAHGHTWITRKAAVIYAQSAGQTQLLIAANTVTDKSPM